MPMEQCLSTLDGEGRRLSAQWEATQHSWRDQGTIEFGEQVMTPLEGGQRAAQVLLESLGRMLEQARRIAP